MKLIINKKIKTYTTVRHIQVFFSFRFDVSGSPPYFSVHTNCAGMFHADDDAIIKDGRVDVKLHNVLLKEDNLTAIPIQLYFCLH